MPVFTMPDIENLSKCALCGDADYLTQEDPAAGRLPERMRHCEACGGVFGCGTMAEVLAVTERVDDEPIVAGAIRRTTCLEYSCDD